MDTEPNQSVNVEFYRNIKLQPGYAEQVTIYCKNCMGHGTVTDLDEAVRWGNYHVCRNPDQRPLPQMNMGALLKPTATAIAEQSRKEVHH